MNMQAMKNDMSQQVDSKHANSLDAALNLRDTLQPLMQSAGDSLHALGQGVRTRAVNAAHKTDDYVHANPWQIAGLSAAIGVTIGFLFARRR